MTISATSEAVSSGLPSNDPVAERVPLGDLFRRLPNEARDYALAELAVVRADATRRAISAAWAIGLALVAIALLSGALIAGLVGAILWIGQMLGTGWAILIVVGASLVIAGVAAWLAIGRARQVVTPEPSR